MFHHQIAKVMAFDWLRMVKLICYFLLISQILLQAVDALSDQQNHSACDQPPNPGTCKGKLRYAYDPQSGNCVSFYYTGCTSTGNNFLTFEECRRDCMSKNRY